MQIELYREFRPHRQRAHSELGHRVLHEVAPDQIVLVPQTARVAGARCEEEATVLDRAGCKDEGAGLDGAANAAQRSDA